MVQPPHQAQALIFQRDGTMGLQMDVDRACDRHTRSVLQNPQPKAHARETVACSHEIQTNQPTSDRYTFESCLRNEYKGYLINMPSIPVLAQVFRAARE